MLKLVATVVLLGIINGVVAASLLQVRSVDSRLRWVSIAVAMLAPFSILRVAGVQEAITDNMGLILSPAIVAMFFFFATFRKQKALAYNSVGVLLAVICPLVWL